MAAAPRSTGRRPPLPPDVRLMNVTAAALGVIAAVLVGGDGGDVAGAPAVLRDPRDQASTATSTRNSVSTIRANAAPQLAGNFFTIDLRAVRRAFESVPWVRQAVVAASGRTACACSSRSTGRSRSGAPTSGAEKLVNSFGEVFEANVGDVEDDGLPMLAGPGRQLGARAGDARPASTPVLRRSMRASRRCRCRAAARGRRARHRRRRRARPRQRRRRARPRRALRRHGRPGHVALPAPARIRRPAPQRRLCGAPEGRVDDDSTPATSRPRKRSRELDGEGNQGSGRRPRHRHRQGDGGGRRGACRTASCASPASAARRRTA